MDYAYCFSVVKGIQAGREYYIGMVPLKMLPYLFPNDEEYVLPEFRAQRKLNTARIPVISKYILQNRNDYVFSALAASIDGEFEFVPIDQNKSLGVLEVSITARFLINDGQHRKAAILEAITEDETLKDETISVVFFTDKNLARSQQIFTDLNKHAVKTSNSISELYDARDDLAVITRNVIRNIEFLNTYTDKEKDILGKYSSSLFTLNAFYSANKIIVGNKPENNCESFLLIFWESVTKHMRQWQELQNHIITKIDLRERFIVTQGIVIQALGRIGNYFYINKIENIDFALSGLENINWSRSAKQWQMRAINANGRIITSKKAAMLIANIIKKEIRIPLSKEEKEAEKKLKNVLAE